MPTRPVLAPVLLTVLAPVLRALLAVAAMLLLWRHFETFAPDSADIGGGPLGLMIPSAAAALVAAADGWRLGVAGAVRLWVLTAALVAVLLVGADLLLRAPRPAGDVAIAVVVVVVATAFFAALPLAAAATGGALRERRSRPHPSA